MLSGTAQRRVKSGCQQCLARAAPQLIQCPLHAECLAVGSIIAKRLEHVAHIDETRFDLNRRSRQAVRIPGPIEPFVVLGYDRLQGPWGRNVRHDLAADRDMRPDQGELFVAEAAGLVQ